MYKVIGGFDIMGKSIQRSNQKGNVDNEEIENVPELRFPEFEGEWSETKLGLISSIHDGTHGTHKNVEKGRYLLSAENIENGKVIIKEEPRIIPEEDFNKIHKKYFIENGDILLTIVGSIGRTAIVENYNKEYTFQRSVAIINSDINSYFLNYYIQSPQVQKELKIRTNSSAQGGIYLKELSKIKIKCPSDKEQQKIASLFSYLDKKIDSMEKKSTYLKKLKTTLRQKMFCNNKNTPKLRFPEFKDEWIGYKLKDISIKIKEKNKENEYTIVLSNSAKNGIVFQKDYFDKTIVNSNNLTEYYIVEKEDFIYNPRISNLAPVGPINKNNTGEIGIVSPLYTVFRINKNFNKTFLEHFFKSTTWHKYIKGVANYGARFDRINITQKDLFNLPIKIPNLDEQEKIGNFLSIIDNEIELTEKETSLNIKFKKTLLNKMFI